MRRGALSVKSVEPLLLTQTLFQTRGQSGLRHFLHLEEQEDMDHVRTAGNHLSFLFSVQMAKTDAQDAETLFYMLDGKSKSRDFFLETHHEVRATEGLLQQVLRI